MTWADMANDECSKADGWLAEFQEKGPEPQISQEGTDERRKGFPELEPHHGLHFQRAPSVGFVLFIFYHLLCRK